MAPGIRSHALSLLRRRHARHRDLPARPALPGYLMSRGCRHPGPDPVALRADVAREAIACVPRHAATTGPISDSPFALAPRWFPAARAALPTGGIRQPGPIRAAVGPVEDPASSGPETQSP